MLIFAIFSLFLLLYTCIFLITLLSVNIYSSFKFYFFLAVFISSTIFFSCNMFNLELALKKETIDVLKMFDKITLMIQKLTACPLIVT